jgi:predicted DNA binding protein
VGLVRARHQAPTLAVEGADVVIVGYFSGKQKDFAALMDTAAQEMTTRGARVVGRIVQRRGISDGGAKKMALPYSSRTLLSYGKVREAAALCEQTNADAAVFLASLTERQRHVLTGMLGCPAVSLADALTAD